MTAIMTCGGDGPRIGRTGSGIAITSIIFAAPAMVVAHGIIVAWIKSCELRGHPAMPPTSPPKEDIGAMKPEPESEAEDRAPQQNEPSPSTDSTSAAVVRRLLNDPAGLATAWSASLRTPLHAVGHGYCGGCPTEPTHLGQGRRDTRRPHRYRLLRRRGLGRATARERRLVRKLAAAFAAKRITRGDHNPMVGDFDGVAISVFVKIGEDSSVPAGK